MMDKKSLSLGTLVKLSNALDISVDILLEKELKYIEGRIKSLSSLEQQEILDMIDSIVSVPLNYHDKKEQQNKC